MNSKKLILLIFIFTIPIFSQKDIRVLSSSSNSIVIEFTPSYNNFTEQTINNQKYLNISFALGTEETENNFGNPDIKERDLNIGVPSEFGNTIQVINSAYKEIEGKVSPVPYEEGLEENAALKFDVGKDYYSYQPKENLVSFGDFGIIRGIQAQSIRISPVKFFPNQNKIKLYTKIIFQVNYSSNRNNLHASKDDFLKGVVLNYNVAKNWNIHSSNRALKKANIINSVLNKGTWYRFDAPEEGIYKITKNRKCSFT